MASPALNSQSTQNIGNHVRWNPLFHFTAMPIFLLTLIAAIWHDVRHPGLWNTWIIVATIGGTVGLVVSRLQVLSVQDRVIRLEERLRLAQLCDPGFKARIPEISLAQLVALRFASDSELPALAAKALNDKLDPKQIKSLIRDWRADWFRA